MAEDPVSMVLSVSVLTPPTANKAYLPAALRVQQKTGTFSLQLHEAVMNGVMENELVVDFLCCASPGELKSILGDHWFIELSCPSSQGLFLPCFLLV